VQPSSKSGGASRLGGPISLSNRDFASSNQAALPNSNRLNQSVDGIDARQDADMSAYLQQLQEQVRRHWIPGLTQSSRRTVLHFTVSRAGLVSNIRIAQTSGLSMTDEAALNAVKQAVPFAPLPTAYTENYINIQFTFNINIYGELELGRDGQ
jgi:TonB family protein